MFFRTVQNGIQKELNILNQIGQIRQQKKFDSIASLYLKQ